MRPDEIKHVIELLNNNPDSMLVGLVTDLVIGVSKVVDAEHELHDYIKAKEPVPSTNVVQCLPKPYGKCEAVCSTDLHHRNYPFNVEKGGHRTCSGFAVYSVLGKHLCLQHAGRALLERELDDLLKYGESKCTKIL